MTLNKISKKSHLKVCFIFYSKAIGGAEKSMLRLIKHAVENELFICEVILANKENIPFKHYLEKAGAIVHHQTKFSFSNSYKIFDTIKPDVVYIFGRLKSVLNSVSAKACGAKIVIAERSSMTRIADWASRFIEQFFIDAYLTNSKAAASQIKRLLITKRKVNVIYNGIDIPSHAESLSIKEVKINNVNQIIQIICVANITPNKGQIVLLRAANALKNIYPNLRVLLIGSDYTNGQFTKIAQNEQLSSIYEWKGYVDDVYEELKQADIFVLPSIFREGTPTSILEAMVYRVPVVSTVIGGIQEIVEHNRTGILVKPNDSKELEEAILTLIQHPDISKKIVSSAWEYVKSHHSIDEMTKRHLAFFVDLTTSSPL